MTLHHVDAAQQINRKVESGAAPRKMNGKSRLSCTQGVESLVEAATLFLMKEKR